MIEKTIAEKNEVEVQINDIKAQMAVLPSLSLIGRGLSESKLRLESFLYMRNITEDQIQDRHKSDYLELKEKIHSFSSQLQNAKVRKEKLTAQLSTLTDELIALTCIPSLEGILDLQEKLTNSQDELYRLGESVIEVREKVDSNEGERRNELAKLSRKREDLLADIAGGVTGQKDALEKLELEITEQESLHDKEIDAIQLASHTVAGISRKIKQAEKQVELHKTNLNAGVLLYLNGEIEKFGAKYKDLSQELSEVFVRVIAMADLCGKLGKQVNVYSPYTYQFKIPSFNIDSCLAAEDSERPGMLFWYDSVNFPEAVLKEMDLLKNLGINIPV